MRISDWSSDVCSSDLRDAGHRGRADHLVTGFGGLPRSDAAHMRNPPGKAGENRPGTLDIRRITASHNGKRPSSRPRRTTGHRCIDPRSEEHTSELQSLMRISYAVFCLKKKT